MRMPTLADTIHVLKDRIKKYRSTYDRNEMATRSQVVEPLLRVLGWDAEDPDKVQPNLSAEEGIPDYTLFLGEKKVLFVEAKKMSVDIEDRQVLGQLAKYCFGEGMSYGLLTNGVIWILFRAFQKDTTMIERIVWKADVEHDDISAVLRKMSTISVTNIGNIDMLLTKLRILDEVWQSLLDDLENLVKGVVPVFQSLAHDAHPDCQLSSEEIEDFIQERLPEILTVQPEIPEPPSPSPPESPRTMKIERESFSVRNSYDMLVLTAEWLIKKGKLRKDNCPVVAGHKRYLVNTEPKHRYGGEFRAPKKLSNGLFIETHYSTSQCIINARKLLAHCGLNGSLLEVG
jgi:hypothetical protein